MLSPMRFKEFTFPHNPRVYTISYTREMAVHKVPMGFYTLQDLGRTYRVMEGEGEFYGPDAYETFKALAMTFYDGGPGVLIHPVWQTSRAYLTRLQLRQEPRENYVAYAFTFREGFFDYAGLTRMDSAAVAADEKAETRNLHTVAVGESLRGICQQYGLTLAQVLAVNPQIANPNRIAAGTQVVLP